MIGLIKEIGLNRFSLWIFHLKRFIEYVRLSLDYDYRVKEINLEKEEKSTQIRAGNSLAQDQHMQDLVMITLGQKKHPEYITTRPVVRPKRVNRIAAPVKTKQPKRRTGAAVGDGKKCQHCGEVWAKPRSNRVFCVKPKTCKNDYNNHR